jgi:hypothetical protein
VFAIFTADSFVLADFSEPHRIICLVREERDLAMNLEATSGLQEALPSSPVSIFKVADWSTTETIPIQELDP